MPKKDDSEFSSYGEAVRQHILGILEKGVSRRQMSEALGVTRQAISSYAKGRTTPKPHIMKKLLTTWPDPVSYRRSTFGVEAYDVPSGEPPEPPEERTLFDIKSITKENLRIEVVNADESSLRLAVEIKIA